MRILLTNDDGIGAPGLEALYAAVSDLGHVHVVAPAKVQSATSHAVTFHRSIQVTQHRGDRFVGMAVDGRPADCVKLALTELIPQPVDLCISGMNAGANVGINVIYSGTVAAAREAAFSGVPAIAVSLHVGNWQAIDWSRAVSHAKCIIDRVLRGPFTGHSIVNMNVPILDNGAEPLGIRVVPISTSPLVMTYAKENLNGANSYQATNTMTFDRRDPDTDVDALFAGYITLTPLHFDLTFQPQLSQWRDHLHNGSGDCAGPKISSQHDD